MEVVRAGYSLVGQSKAERLGLERRRSARAARWLVDRPAAIGSQTFYFRAFLPGSEDTRFCRVATATIA